MYVCAYGPSLIDFSEDFWQHQVAVISFPFRRVERVRIQWRASSDRVPLYHRAEPYRASVELASPSVLASQAGRSRCRVPLALDVLLGDRQPFPFPPISGTSRYALLNFSFDFGGDELVVLRCFSILKLFLGPSGLLLIRLPGNPLSLNVETRTFTGLNVHTSHQGRERKSGRPSEKQRAYEWRESANGELTRTERVSELRANDGESQRTESSHRKEGEWT